MLEGWQFQLSTLLNEISISGIGERPKLFARVSLPKCDEVKQKQGGPTQSPGDISVYTPAFVLLTRYCG